MQSSEPTKPGLPEKHAHISFKQQVTEIKNKAQLDETVDTAVGKVKKDGGFLNRAEIDVLEVGEAFVEKILSMKSDIVKLKNQLTDSVIRHDADIKAYKEQLRGKDNTIRELQADVGRLQKAVQHKSRKMPLAEIANFK